MFIRNIYLSKIGKYIVSLKDNDFEDEDNKDFYIKNYELKQCTKKTLKPKAHFPGYSPSSLLEDFINERISFVSKNDLNIKLWFTNTSITFNF